MTRVYYSELLAKNALKAEEIKISVLIPLCYYRELHIQISQRFRALLDLKVGVRIGVTFPTVTLAWSSSSGAQPAAAALSTKYKKSKPDGSLSLLV